jgi:hypothetical protein
MLLWKALLGLIVSGGVTTLAQYADSIPDVLSSLTLKPQREGGNETLPWPGLMTGMCEVLLEHLSVPLGTVSPYLGDMHLKG